MAHLKSGVELRPMRVCGVLGARLGVDTSLFSGQDTETALRLSPCRYQSLNLTHVPEHSAPIYEFR